MEVYVTYLEDNLPSENNWEITGVFKNIEDARDKVKRNYLLELDNIEDKDCSSVFYEYFSIVEDGYWEIRSKTDESYYMSEGIETFKLS